jgi:hypothetical protein
VGFLVIALSAAGYSVYMIAQVVTRKHIAWNLAALPAFLVIIAFCGLIAYAGAYFVATGRRWPKADVLSRVAGRLNSNIRRSPH